MTVLHTAQVRDAFDSAYRNTDSTSEERERLFYGWFNNELANAWREGAVYGFAHSGEEWNGEYANGPDPDVGAIVDGFTNPYKTEEC